ncbi:hypothetical protein BGW80DRAFT_1257395 [Lactifluus volemus]|nr:hypothetical protein BGW80DRAFT_1257395 [Lactifluus volemus]
MKMPSTESLPMVQNQMNPQFTLSSQVENRGEKKLYGDPSEDALTNPRGAAREGPSRRHRSLTSAGRWTGVATATKMVHNTRGWLGSLGESATNEMNSKQPAMIWDETLDDILSLSTETRCHGITLYVAMSDKIRRIRHGGTESQGSDIPQSKEGPVPPRRIAMPTTE